MEWNGSPSLASEMGLQEGLGTYGSDRPQKDAALKLLQPACLRLDLLGMPKQARTIFDEKIKLGEDRQIVVVDRVNRFRFETSCTPS